MEFEPEQEELLDALVEDARSVPRSEREDFVLLAFERGAIIQGPGGATGGFPTSAYRVRSVWAGS